MSNVYRTIDGTQHTLPRLTVRQIIELSARLHERRRAQIIADAKAVGANGADSLRSLAEHDATRDMVGGLIRHAFTVAGSTEIVRMSAGEATDAILAEIPPDEWVTLALDLINATRATDSGKAEGGSGADG